MEMVQSNKQVVSVSEQTVRARKNPLFRTTVGAEMTVKPEAVCVPAMGAITGQVSENISDTRVFGSSGGGGTSVPVRSVLVCQEANMVGSTVFGQQIVVGPQAAS